MYITSMYIFTGAAQGFRIDGAKYFQTRAIVANFLLSPQNLTGNLPNSHPHPPPYATPAVIS